MDLTRNTQGMIGGLLLVWAAFGASAGEAATYYVATTGSNTTSCAQAVNPSTPKQTISSGISCLSAGDTLIVKAGTYNEAFNDPFSNTGTSWTNKITVKAESPKSVAIKPTSGDIVMSFQGASQKYVEFDGIEIDAGNVTKYGLRIWGFANHIRFKNSAILHAADQGISIIKDAGGSPDFNEFINVEVAYTAMNTNGTLGFCNGNRTGSAGFCHGFYVNGDNTLLDGVHLHHNNGYGIQFYPSDNRDNTIRNSTSHDNFAVGIGSFGDNNKIINNVIYNNNKWMGVQVAASNNLIYYNTVYNNVGDGLYVSGSGHSVKNNIVYQNSVSGITLDSTNLVGTNPQFVDPATGNFRLKAASPAIDRGAPLAGITTAIDGSLRPQGAAPDIGAYEFGGVVANAAAPGPPQNPKVF